MSRPVDDAAPVDDPSVAAAKKSVRADVRRRRAQRSEAERHRDDAARTRLLIERLAADAFATVAAYLSSGTEPDSLGVLEWLALRQVEVLLPASTGGAWSEPAWATYTGPEQLRTGPREIFEPTSQRLPGDAIATAEVVLCPGLAGTLRGDRLGRGGGWYDRVLPLATGRLILLLNDDEVLDALPTGPLDRRVDAIVTPTRLLDCR